MQRARNNFPIKYAIMPIIKQVGWYPGVNELEREYDTVYYIVSRCYLLSETKRYDGEGNEEMSYEVVFPFQNKETTEERVYPEFNFNGVCYNSSRIKKVYEADEIEEVLEEVQKKNKELLGHQMAYIPFSIENMKRCKEAFTQTEQQYSTFEEEIEKVVKQDMVFQNLPEKENSLVLAKKNKVNQN